MLKVERFVMPVFDENAYVVSDETGECVLVDCGGQTSEENEKIVHFIESHKLEVKHLVCTHFHLDHILGNAYFEQRYGVHPQVCPAEQRLVSIIDYQAMALNYEGKVETGELQFTLEDGALLSFGNSVLKVIHTPGHSPGSVCLYSENDGVLISGDTLMKGSIGSTSLPGGRKKAIARSVGMLLQLPDETAVYPGHGDATTIGAEKANDLLANDPTEEKTYKSVDI